MLTDCPYCHTRVVPKADGTCPACQKNALEATRPDSSWTTIRVSQGDVLPPICCECGQPTSRVVAISRTARPGGEPSTSVGVAVFLVFSWLLGLWLMLRGMANTTAAKVTLPQCESCGRRGPPEPRYVDFANARMTFLVHKNLKDAMND
jgi:hypothetical protein